MGEGKKSGAFKALNTTPWSSGGVSQYLAKEIIYVWIMEKVVVDKDVITYVGNNKSR
jgi:hypothetical protein